MQHASPLFSSRRQHSALPVCAEGCCVVRMTVDVATVTELRQLAMRVCGEALEFMRIAVCAGGERIDVWLCVRLSCAPTLTDTIRLHMPHASLGHDRP